MDSLAGVIFMVIYLGIGIALGKRYWQTRHGVYKKVLGGGLDVVFSAVFPWIFLWPIFLFVPKFRRPELCSCPDHVMIRANSRREAEAYEQAMREERGYR